jgi:hypothetical protein
LFAITLTSSDELYGCGCCTLYKLFNNKFIDFSGLNITVTSGIIIPGSTTRQYFTTRTQKAVPRFFKSLDGILYWHSVGVFATLWHILYLPKAFIAKANIGKEWTLGRYKIGMIAVNEIVFQSDTSDKIRTLIR